jgi:coenzyme PQQ precursor peptide PqqA
LSWEWRSDLLLGASGCRGPALEAKSREKPVNKRNAMAWTTPTLIEICIGLEINGYLPPEF